MTAKPRVPRRLLIALAALLAFPRLVTAAEEKVTVSVALFGTFGYKEAGLFDEYQKLHPNVTIAFSAIEQEASYWPALQTKMAAGGGVADIQGFETGRQVDVTQGQPDKWTDLRQFGADALKDRFYPFKWAGGLAKGGAVLGLGTDTGPMAICYRKDLLAKAGLPTDRAELAKAWSTWDRYLALGEQFMKKAPKGTAWIDTANSVYAAALGQNQKRYYDGSGRLDYETSASVKGAWDKAMKSISLGLTARLQAWSPAWNQAFASGSFATIACPAWMLGYIKGQAGDKGAGLWDVAALPGGGGNWGGSYLGVPAAAKHKKEAAELAMWLTAPEQQVKLFVKQGSFPSSPQAAADPAVTGLRHPYFSDAPVGKIFAESAAALGPQTKGLKDRVVENAITNTGIIQVEQQDKTPEQGWKAAVEAAKKAIEE